MLAGWREEPRDPSLECEYSERFHQEALVAGADVSRMVYRHYVR